MYVRDGSTHDVYFRHDFYAHMQVWYLLRCGYYGR